MKIKPNQRVNLAGESVATTGAELSLSSYPYRWRIVSETVRLPALSVGEFSATLYFFRVLVI